MNKNTNTYRLLTFWLLAAVLINLVYPAGMKAAQLFCEKDSAQTHVVTENKTSLSCWMNMGADTKEKKHLTNHCLLNQVCEQAINFELNETPVIQHQDIQIPGIPLTGSIFSPTLKIADKLFPEKSLLDNLNTQEIYLLNSTFLI
ncbi:hypothetical protein [Fodinibius sp.]|uniref:hypothetical protein n=1 Tax=Fodinibius sp. TaxID=1872440 RepID=UPI002ACEBBFF|nr:hypothetical protein [Fodinibius sp.]MDZ7660537.1 hypothetical protein [Fodinibius sp.]